MMSVVSLVDRDRHDFRIEAKGQLIPAGPTVIAAAEAARSCRMVP